MPYLLAIVIVAIAVVLGTFTGVWGGLVWIVVAASCSPPYRVSSA